MIEKDFQSKLSHYTTWLYSRIETQKLVKLSVSDKYIVRKSIEDTIQILLPEYKQRDAVDFGMVFMQINFKLLKEYDLNPYDC